ncbi:hypothetical protein FYJ43_04705 [Cutibacterium sp. WCA-380-WT-3A]|uniref:Uncharacterized protein n=1 Tax=Cutibacterium porci TaxID=2605781 RepID=A0A7K0J5X7_9ACTN|nr:hypothetical protein [Cutibacterium porci]MSS45351.1 hypothetical protein [Cutibacterium porci]
MFRINYLFSPYSYLPLALKRSTTYPLNCEEPQDAPSQKENYTPGLNSYAALWNEYKEAPSSTTLLNVTRRIYEQYFLRLCSYDSADLTTTLLKNNRDQFIHTDTQGQEDLSAHHLATSILTYHKNRLEDDTYLIAENYGPINYATPCNSSSPSRDKNSSTK